MLQPSREKQNATEDVLQIPSQGVSSCYIFSEETLQSLQALGEVLRRIHNRLEMEKSAVIGINSANNDSMRK